MLYFFLCKILSKFHAIFWGELSQNSHCFATKVQQKCMPLYLKIFPKNCFKKTPRICFLRNLSQNLIFLHNFHKDLLYWKSFKNKLTFLDNFHNYFALLGKDLLTFFFFKFSKKKSCPIEKFPPKFICLEISKTKLVFLEIFSNN